MDYYDILIDGISAEIYVSRIIHTRSWIAAELLKRGWYLGFDGPITYKNARKALEVLQMCPLERMVIETDSPYLTPVPNRGKRNDSSNLKYVIDKIAEVKGVSASEVERATFENGKKLYGMEDM